MEWTKTLWILLVAYAGYSIWHEFYLLGGTHFYPSTYLLWLAAIIPAAAFAAFKFRGRGLAAVSPYLLWTMMLPVLSTATVDLIAPNMLLTQRYFEFVAHLALFLPVVPAAVCAANLPMIGPGVFGRAANWLRAGILLAVVPLSVIMMVSFTDYLIAGIRGLSSEC